MAEPISAATAALSEAERLVHAGDIAAAVEVLEGIVDHEPTVAVLYMLASTCVELGEHDKAFLYASTAAEKDPASAPARDVLAKVTCGRGGLRFRVVGLRSCCHAKPRTA